MFRKNKIVGLMGNLCSGKSAIVELLVKDGFIPVTIDSCYSRTPRVNTEVEWHQDKEYGLNAYKLMLDGILKNYSEGRDVVIESTGVGLAWKDLIEKLELVDGVNLQLIFLDVPYEVSKKRLEIRNSQNPEIICTIEELDYFTNKLENAKSLTNHTIDGSKPLQKVCESVKLIIN